MIGDHAGGHGGRPRDRWSLFHVGGLTGFAPLPAAGQFPEREEFAATAAFAFDLRDPEVLPSAEAGNVRRDELRTDQDEPFAGVVPSDLVGLRSGG